MSLPGSLVYIQGSVEQLLPTKKVCFLYREMAVCPAAFYSSGWLPSARETSTRKQPWLSCYRACCRRLRPPWPPREAVIHTLVSMTLAVKSSFYPTVWAISSQVKASCSAGTAQGGQARESIISLNLLPVATWRGLSSERHPTLWPKRR